MKRWKVSLALTIVGLTIAWLSTRPVWGKESSHLWGLGPYVAGSTPRMNTFTRSYRVRDYSVSRDGFTMNRYKVVEKNFFRKREIASSSRARQGRRLRMEALEPRQLLSAIPPFPQLGSISLPMGPLLPEEALFSSGGAEAPLAPEPASLSLAGSGTIPVESNTAVDFSLQPVGDVRIGSSIVNPDGASGYLSSFNDPSLPNVQRTLLRFDISSLPAGQEIESATLTLYRHTSPDGDNADGRALEIYRLTRAWNETEATWNLAAEGSNWSNPGAGNDFVGTTGAAGTDPYASSTANPAKGQPITWDVTELVRQWYDGAHENHGLLLLGQAVNKLHFFSRESGGPSLSPTLDIDFAGAGSFDGDLNGDGFVGGDDLDIIRTYWGQQVTPGDLLAGDPSGDGNVGGDDLDIVRANWGNTKPVEPAQPVLYRKISIPDELLTQSGGYTFGGDIRMGDLTGNGKPDYVVFRSADGGIKPVFLGAFDQDGQVLWQVGSGGGQPLRPGSVSVYDVNGDGRDEVICLFRDPNQTPTSGNFADMVIQIRDGRTGAVLKQSAPEALTSWSTADGGTEGNWCHQRILVANFRGNERPQDFAIKLGFDYLAFDDDLNLLWQHRIPEHDAYEHCSYVPAVGDLDGDGRDELFGGQVMLEEDGSRVWYNVIAHHMDSVVILPWDNGTVRAIGSGYGQVLDKEGNVIVKLGATAVPHGQEVRVADFVTTMPGPEMVIRYNGHDTDVMLVNNQGEIVSRFDVNSSPNETGMEAVLWAGENGPAILYNGGMLWHGTGNVLATLPGLPNPVGPKTNRTMAWYHCIPANVCGDGREEVVLYNPWDKYVWIYTPNELDEEAFSSYETGPRQYNVRLMD